MEKETAPATHAIQSSVPSEETSTALVPTNVDYKERCSPPLVSQSNIASETGSSGCPTMSTTDEGNSPNKLSLSFLLCEGNSAKQKESTPGNPDSGSQPSGGYQNSEDSQLSPPSISQSPSVSPSSSTTPSPTSRPIRDSRGHSPPIELAADLARRTSSVMSYHPESGVVSHPDEIGGPSQWLDNTDKLLDQIRVFTQHPGLKLEHMADLQMFLFQHNATREQHHDPILATTPVTEPSSSTSNGTGRRRRGSRQALHTASVNPSQSGMFVGADLHRQIEQYGAKLFAKDRDGNYECFFEYCNKKMANNFSRHIYGHEQRGDHVRESALSGEHNSQAPLTGVHLQHTLSQHPDITPPVTQLNHTKRRRTSSPIAPEAKTGSASKQQESLSMLFSQFSSPQHPTIAIPASPGTTSTSAHGSSHNWESTAGPTPSLSSLLQQHFDFGNMQIPVATTHQQQLPQHHHIQQHNESQSHTPSDTNNTHTTNTSPGIHSHQHQHQSHNVNTGSPAQHHSPTIGTAEESSITLGTKPLPNFSALTAALFTVSNNS